MVLVPVRDNPGSQERIRDVVDQGNSFKSTNHHLTSFQALGVSSTVHYERAASFTTFIDDMQFLVYVGRH
ncbi:uncharacterized protein BKA55DRAFT_562667 [Fusarium redolens]|uniref:Uncharacterized protein n=1 Tax=Fusarium redolens TaxID=48865 RepID=A0A9P9HN79_FUSRE|nr:uncharacterized protein BKA55DRAFT_562667 [Fusarium redolens]KAH7259509.1 hypothetical protein BKA55DRAFT_562667 [Fusarium redolens]